MVTGPLLRLLESRYTLHRMLMWVLSVYGGGIGLVVSAPGIAMWHTFRDPRPLKSLYRKWPSSVVYLLHCHAMPCSKTLSLGGWWKWKCQINILLKTL